MTSQETSIPSIPASSVMGDVFGSVATSD
jgi:hypothetical protein